MNRSRLLRLIGQFGMLFLILGTAVQLFVPPIRAQEPDWKVLFSDDFEEGDADQWDLEPGWRVTLDGGNHVLSGEGHTFARLTQAEQLGTIESFESRINLLAGSVHVNYRLHRMGSRYFVRLEEGGLALFKSTIRQPVPQEGDIFDHVQLSRAETWLGRGTWHKLRIVGTANHIEVYVDDELVTEYTDQESPYLDGFVAFETLEDSHVLVDDVLLGGQPPSAVQPGLEWTFTGGPRGGIGYDIRIHPLDPNILWVTDAHAGAHQSLDGGHTWAPKNEGITARVGHSGDAIPIFSLTIDPHNPDIIWAGARGTRGVFRSVDGGETWTEMDNGIAQLPEMEIRAFTVDPTNSNIVYCGGNYLADPATSDQRGFIYKTTDGGESWVLLHEPGALVRWIIVDPTDNDIVYASTGIFDRFAIQPEGVLKSTDGGQTWTNINEGLTSLAVGGLAMHPNDPQTLIGATGKAGHFVDEEREIYGGVFKTTDGGQHWLQVDPIRAATHEIGFSAVAFAPSNPNIVYADAGHLFLRSRDGGESWTQYDVSASGGENRGQPIALAVHPANPDVVYMNAYDGGVFISTDAGRTWEDASAGYTGSQSWDIAVDPSDPARVVVGSKNGVHRTIDGGGTWQGRNTNGWINNISAVAVHPSDRNLFLIGREIAGTVWRTANGGASWGNVLGPLGEDTPTGRRTVYRIAFAPSNPMIVYAATGIGSLTVAVPRDTLGPGVYKSTNGGRTWSAVNRGLEDTTLNVLDAAVHPRDPDTVYIGTLNSGVYKSTTGGDTWFAARGGLGPYEIRSIAIDPHNAGTIYAGAEFGGVWKSTDEGTTWRQISYGLPPEASVRSIVVDPAHPGEVYSADRHTGVYRSADGGATWTQVNSGLLMRAVNTLAISSDGQHLYAATEGGGVFRLDLSGVPPQPPPTPTSVPPAPTPIIQPTVTSTPLPRPTVTSTPLAVAEASTPAAEVAEVAAPSEEEVTGDSSRGSGTALYVVAGLVLLILLGIGGAVIARRRSGSGA